MPLPTNWLKCYGEGWTGVITPEAFCHPAKFSRALIRRIYAHAIEEGWVETNSVVVDPFGGVALGGLEAMRRGLHWVGVELEERFCVLAQENIDLWNSRYAGQMPNWGTAVIVQGDSRRLGEVLARARLCLSSPPYAGSVIRGGLELATVPLGKRWAEKGETVRPDESGYGETAGNLGNLPDTGFEAALAVSSPAWHKVVLHDGGPVQQQGGELHSDYGSEPGQLAQMPEGDLALAISSPPFLAQSGGTNVTAQSGPLADASLLKRHSAGNQAAAGYGNSDGQLAALPEGDHAQALEAGAVTPACACLCGHNRQADTADRGRAQCAISSPPWENMAVAAGDQARDKGFSRYDPSTRSAPNRDGLYSVQFGDMQGQLGNETGSTFWAASRAILEQVYQVLAPNAHAIFVCKRFVRNKAIVDFPLQWAHLCEAVGFTWIHHHKAWLVEDRGAQHTLEGGLEEHKVERKSFFRRLAESKGSPRIDYEDVLCFVKESQ